VHTLVVSHLTRRKNAARKIGHPFPWSYSQKPVGGSTGQRIWCTPQRFPITPQKTWGYGAPFFVVFLTLQVQKRVGRRRLLRKVRMECLPYLRAMVAPPIQPQSLRFAWQHRDERAILLARPSAANDRNLPKVR
jgi:hypothetical protein